MSYAIKGAILILLSAVGYGLMPLLSKLAYAEAVGVQTLLFYRFLFASLLLWLIYAISPSHHTKATWSHKGYLTLLALIGYALPSTALFIAYGRLHTSIVTLILFVHPIFVVFFERLFFGIKLNWLKFVAAFMTILGLWLILAEPDFEMDPWGIWLSLFGAITYGVYCLGLYEKRTKQTSTIYVTAFVLTVCCLFNGIWLLIAQSGFGFSSLAGLFYTLILAVAGTLLPAIAFNKGLKIIGPGTATVISTFEPVVVATAGTFLLAEPFTLKLLIGGLIILAAVLMATFQTKANAK